MATYVIVHGGWHGEWCWKRLTPLLQAAGHRVFAPTLTGLAERADLLTPDVGISTHIQDIVQVLENNHLEEVILLGHSYGGMIITGVVDQVPGRVAHLVYLDTFVPKDGESMADIVPVNVRGLRKDALAHGDGWRVAPMREIPFGLGGAYGVTQETNLSWVKSMVTPQSLRTFEEHLHLRNPDIVSSKPRTYILCTGVTVMGASLSRPSAPTTDAIEEYVTSSSGLQNLGNGYYQWNWKSQIPTPTPARHSNWISVRAQASNISPCSSSRSKSKGAKGLDISRGGVPWFSLRTYSAPAKSLN